MKMEQSKGFGSNKITQFSMDSIDTDLFNPVVIEKNIVGGRTISLYPLSANEGPYEFYLPPQGDDQYLQLNSIRLSGVISITKQDGTSFADSVDYSVVNMAAHSCFRGTEVEIDNTLVTDLSSFSAHYQSQPQFQSKRCRQPFTITTLETRYSRKI